MPGNHRLDGRTTDETADGRTDWRTDALSPPDLKIVQFHLLIIGSARDFVWQVPYTMQMEQI